MPFIHPQEVLSDVSWGQSSSLRLSARETSECGSVGLQSSSRGFLQSFTRGQKTAAETRVALGA